MGDETGKDGVIRMDEAINEIEGYLLWAAEKDRARTRADAFCAGLPWLTESQRQEVVRHYCRDQGEISRVYLERIAVRSAGLRTEYESVYLALRKRLVAAFLSASAAAAVLLTVAIGLPRP
ncbi:hypothetical protein [Streptomyces sp. GS7]|uniref:hypothetical protein n=1 Tax=Streptomyces sp. GS7 TaxID=2692234 RepID=UPI00131991DE|nr:hypothetical protein [Streptomyces sp. GS7]QHC21322.1 hypothetical protein GR130_07660 [Streptomyces sp. GS7]